MCLCLLKVNANDDLGILLGKWEHDYRDGVKPTAWTGSAKILQQWLSSKFKPVRYRQCLVFASVLCTGTSGIITIRVPKTTQWVWLRFWLNASFFLDLMSSCLPPWPGKKFDPLIKVGWTTLRFFFLPLFRLLLKYKTCSLPYTKVVFLPLDTDLVLLMKNSDVKQTAFLFSEECSFTE